MTTTNFNEWTQTYDRLLMEKYLQFCMLFEEDEEPEFYEFVSFVWNNTRKFVDPFTQKTYARIN
jgi:hypothetical protein